MEWDRGEKPLGTLIYCIADKWSLGRYSSLADSDHGGEFL
jgi:hypothetical protein